MFAFRPTYRGLLHKPCALPKNREAAYVLAVFLARFWSAPERIVEAFHIDRRALAGHDGLDHREADPLRHPYPRGGRVHRPRSHLWVKVQTNRERAAPQADPLPVWIGVLLAVRCRE